MHAIAIPGQADFQPVQVRVTLPIEETFSAAVHVIELKVVASGPDRAIEMNAVRG